MRRSSALDELPEREGTVSTLIAVGYPDQTAAGVAAADAPRLLGDLVSRADQIAVLRRDREGKFHVCTNQGVMTAGVATYAMFWHLLFGVLFFIPVLGMAVGAGLGALLDQVEAMGLDGHFRDEVRDMLQPGTSALFIVVDAGTPGQAIVGARRLGGTVLWSCLSATAQAQLHADLYGDTFAVV
jgi:uncharacterized membrane protein